MWACLSRWLARGLACVVLPPLFVQRRGVCDSHGVSVDNGDTADGRLGSASDRPSMDQQLVQLRCPLSGGLWDSRLAWPSPRGEDDGGHSSLGVCTKCQHNFFCCAAVSDVPHCVVREGMQCHKVLQNPFVRGATPGRRRAHWHAGAPGVLQKAGWNGPTPCPAVLPLGEGLSDICLCLLLILVRVGLW